MRYLVFFLGLFFINSCSSATKEEKVIEDQVAQDAQESMGADAEVRQEDEALNITLDDILFEFNKTTLKAKGKEVIGKLANIMKDYPTTIVHITGHSDNIGSKAAKIKIANGRAKTVADYIKSHGVATSRVTHQGLSDTQPRLSNKTKKDRQKNRRVEMRLEVKKPIQQTATVSQK